MHPYIFRNPFFFFHHSSVQTFFTKHTHLRATEIKVCIGFSRFQLTWHWPSAEQRAGSQQRIRYPSQLLYLSYTDMEFFVCTIHNFYKSLFFFFINMKLSIAYNSEAWLHTHIYCFKKNTIKIYMWLCCTI